MYQMYTTTHVHDLVEIEDDFCFSKTENLEQPSTKITQVFAACAPPHITNKLFLEQGSTKVQNANS